MTAQPRPEPEIPGSDAALAFAMLNVLVSDGLIDRDFIDAHTVVIEKGETS